MQLVGTQYSLRSKIWKGSQHYCISWAHIAIWGKLGTALQAYTLSPCTKFPQIPLLEMSTLKS